MIEVVILAPAVMLFVLLMLAISARFTAEQDLQAMVNQSALEGARPGQQWEDMTERHSWGPQTRKGIEDRAIGVLLAIDPNGSNSAINGVFEFDALSPACEPGTSKATVEVERGPKGHGGSVEVTAGCDVPLSGISLPGAPTTVRVEAHGSALIDEHRDCDN